MTFQKLCSGTVQKCSKYQGTFGELKGNSEKQDIFEKKKTKRHIWKTKGQFQETKDHLWKIKAIIENKRTILENEMAILEINGHFCEVKGQVDMRTRALAT